ncbi:hypothetical protein BGZ96_002047 [Linnemannia gamsii]|uniref:Sacsin/Nov domain-containing protein n=1 Tax=Linnemannia gamsii TaxID=64522 RepID=A0ABQ7K9G0_9FUNG|nr:hypothetical protein BGZ96_002047 [Linnemannia gamsii]
MSLHSSSPSSSSSSSNPTFATQDDEIEFLRRRLDRMERCFDDQFNNTEDSAITTQPPLQHYCPTESEVQNCPLLKPDTPIEFFTKSPLKESEFSKNIRDFPKNVYMDGYKAPRVPQVVSRNITFSTKHDGQIRDFQERCAEITRPVDFFFHEFSKLQQFDKEQPNSIDSTTVLQIALDFSTLMRQHLGALAVKMHDTRMANVREAAGATFEDDSLRRFDPQSLHDHVKSVRNLQSVFRATKKGSDNHRGKGDYNSNNNGSNGHGNNSHGNNGNWPAKVRAIGPSEAIKKGARVDDVVIHGNWSSSVIFDRFYRLTSASSNQPAFLTKYTDLSVISVLDCLEPEIIQKSLTNRIRAIHDEYPGGIQISQELHGAMRMHAPKSNARLHHKIPPSPASRFSFHEDLHKYMGPALLAGSDSVFEEKDFVSLRNLASSEERMDGPKTGQTGIRFNSIYHLTECPSFITGDKVMLSRSRPVPSLLGTAGVVNWMDAKWKTVPRRPHLEPPYDITALDLPPYMAFSKLNHQTASRFNILLYAQKLWSWMNLLKHLNMLVKDIAPLWKSMEELFTLKAHLFKSYNLLERYTSASKASREWSTQNSTFHLKVPTPAKHVHGSWPAQLMLDIDNIIPSHQVVEPGLYQYRTFLVATGAAEMVHVEGTVQVADGWTRRDMEDRIMNFVETQDQQTGFMDVRFKFEEGLEILTHKGCFSTSKSVLPESNGVPVLEHQKEGGEPVVAEEFGSDDEEAESGDRQQKPVEDKLAQSVQYLMNLQDVASRFEVSRLKDLIAQELIMGQKMIHSNVFSIRNHVERNQADNVREHCDQFIGKSKVSVMKYVEGEIRVLRDKLEEWGRREETEEDDDDDDYEPSQWSDDEDEAEMQKPKTLKENLFDQENPLENPKIRTRIALFLSSKDCIACMQVSRDWFQDFVRPVWHTIKFPRDRKFQTIDPKVLNNYGQFIKQVRNISLHDELKSLQHAKIDSLTAVSFVLEGDWHYRELVADLIRRCCSLPAMPSTDVEYGLRLNYLSLSRSCITREGFSALLQCSPVLQILKLFQVVVLRYNASLNLFRKSSIIYLEAPLGEILMPDPQLPGSPSLLVHMPLLQEWTFTSLERPTTWTDDTLRKELSDNCRLLKSLRFDKTTTTTSTGEIASLVLKCAQKLESCTFSAQDLNLAMAFACISHLDTLTSLTITVKKSLVDISYAMEWVYYIPKLCSNLKVLSIQEVVLEMKEIECRG